MVRVGEILDLRRGARASVRDVARAAEGKRFVLLGEQHATAAHQWMQADVIEALAREGREVIVGLEMLQRPRQGALDAWVRGGLTEEALLAETDWKGQWGFNFAFYRPVFEVARRRRLPMVALNVPRDWVRAVGRGGLEALNAEARAALPAEIFLGNAEHRRIFEAMMGGHPMTGARGENIYAAQVLWDEGMADTAIRYLADRRVSKKTVFVVLAGAGHVMYGQGIGYRLARRKAGEALTVVMTEGEGPTTVARGLADFVYLSKG